MWLAPAATAFVAAAALAYWLTPDRFAPDERLREPVGPVAPSTTASAKAPKAIDIRGQFARGPGQLGTDLGAWPAFRGPNRDAVSPEQVRLARSWPGGKPPELWRVELGEGYAGPAVQDGCVYVLDYDAKAKSDALRCLSLADGREIWRRWYHVNVPRQHGMSRTVPAVAGPHVVSLGPLGQVLCADSRSGDFRWGIDLAAQYGTKVPPWYAGQCPLIDNGRAIIAPAGRALMIAVDAATGRVLWETPNPRSWQMTHGSIAVMEFAGRRMYVYCGSGGVAGVWADDGRILWDYPDWSVPMANVPMPVPMGDGRIFLTGGYKAGSLILQLEAQGDRVMPRAAARLKQEVFGSEQQTPIFFGGHLYGVLSKDAGALKEQMVCLDRDGRMLWASGPRHRFGPYGGPYIVADGLILVVDDNGALTLLEATPRAFRPLAQAKVLPGHESWAPMALVGGRLLVRDLTTMVCLDLREQRQ